MLHYPKFNPIVSKFGKDLNTKGKAFKFSIFLLPVNYKTIDAKLGNFKWETKGSISTMLSSINNI